jgi:phosphatidylglycerol:prolipoprotein diacylglycerol transferase
MKAMSRWVYVHNLDPVLLHLGPLRIGWYGLMYAVSFLVGYLLLLRRARRPGAPIGEADVPNLVTYVVLGVVLGGRLGWVIFYGGIDYLFEPWRVLETWKGGMSFHGGLIGVTLALWLYARRNRVPLLKLGDTVIIYVPIGLFFGRLGNFINGELWGRATGGAWGVIFPADRAQVPRHPSQLYEAALEGVLIFAVLYALRNVKRDGLQPAMFLLLYGLCRGAIEFVRLPDADIGYLWGAITMGQLLSLPMILAGLVWVIYLFTRAPSPAAPAR